MTEEQRRHVIEQWERLGRPKSFGVKFGEKRYEVFQGYTMSGKSFWVNETIVVDHFCKKDDGQIT